MTKEQKGMAQFYLQQYADILWRRFEAEPDEKTAERKNEKWREVQTLANELGKITEE